MSDKSKGHSELVAQAKEAALVLNIMQEGQSISDPLLPECQQIIDALESLEEQYEALNDRYAGCKASRVAIIGEADALREQLEAAQERLTAYETPGWINSVQKVMEYRQALRETWDDYAVAIDDHASEEVRREARYSMLRRFSAYEEQGWLSNPSSGEDKQRDRDLGADSPGVSSPASEPEGE